MGGRQRVRREPHGVAPDRPSGPAVPAAASAHPLLRLQRQAGNTAVEQLLAAFGDRPSGEGRTGRPRPLARCPSPQPGARARDLLVAPADSPLERVADLLAEQVTRSPSPGPAAGAGAAGRGPLEEDGGAGAMVAPPIVGEVLASAGRAMDPETRGFFEPRFGRDLSAVRIHSDQRAGDSARSVGALAYTVGSDIVFGAGRYDPRSDSGRRLLAHELAHTVQQAPGLARAPAAPDAGNRAVSAAVARQPQTAGTPTSSTGAGPAAVTRPSRSDLITIANGAINAEYASAARDGLSDFESIVGSSSDFGPVLTAMIGNLIWAAGCFATGSAAFLMGLAGVAGGVVAPAASGRIDATEFHRFAADQIDALVQHLLNQTTRVTSEVDAVATAQNLDENQTRSLLLNRLFKPSYIMTVEGGLPTVNRRAIAQRVSTDLLVRANTYRASLLRPGGGGRFIYDYDVTNHVRTSGWWILSTESLRPVREWRFERRGVGIWVPQGESAAVEAFRREQSVAPAAIPWAKSVYLNFSTSGGLDIFLGPDNAVVDATGYGVFEEFADPPRRPAARTPPPPADPIGRAREIVAAMWQQSGGVPPVVLGSELTNAVFPGRSRATR